MSAGLEMERGPTDVPMRHRFSFDDFDSDITIVLKEVDDRSAMMLEHSLGTAVMHGTMTVEGALEAMDAYSTALKPPEPELPEAA